VHDNRRYCVSDTGTETHLIYASACLADSDGFASPLGDLFHVDGFRFDLGVTLGRQDNGQSRLCIFRCATQDPVLQRVKLISEPWDLGPGGSAGFHPHSFSNGMTGFATARAGSGVAVPASALNSPRGRGVERFV
jgi:glycogen operon protein